MWTLYATEYNIIRRRRDEICTPDNEGKNTDTHSEYVILIAFPRQKWLHEHASMLRLYVHCLSCFNIPEFCVLPTKYVYVFFLWISIQQNTQCTYNLTSQRVRVTIVAVEKHCITHSQCLSVALIIQHVKRTRRIMSCGLSGSNIFFFTLSHKRHDFWKKCFWI
jgi:hypothetical protein